MDGIEACNQEGVLIVGVLVDVALMPHACHLTDMLITRLYSWERPYSHSQSGYIAFFLFLDCFTFISLLFCRYRASFWHSLCASRFIITALNSIRRVFWTL